MQECPISFSSPDGVMCNGFLQYHSCPAGYFSKYNGYTCPENPPYPNGVTDEDYKKAGHKLLDNL